MTAQMNETANTNQQDIVGDSALSPERATERVEVLGKAQRAKVAARELSRSTSARKNELLLAVADVLVANTGETLVANTRDIEAGKVRGFGDSLLDRLRLDVTRVEDVAGGLRQVAALPDPVGEVLCGGTLPNGIKFSQVSVPLGVVGMVYGACPNITIDAFGLVLKSSNVVLLCGPKSAVHSDAQLIMVLHEALTNHNTPEDLVQLLPCGTHDSIQDLATTCSLVNVAIPRDGVGLTEAVVTKATAPTIKAGTGNCHVYINAPASTDEVIALMTNGKTHRPSVCSATETVLADSTLSVQDQVRILDALVSTGVAIHGDVSNLVTSRWTGEAIPTTAEGQPDECLLLDVAACIIDGVVAVTSHITKYSSGHVEAIFACGWDVYQELADRVDVATINVNTSAAFTDDEQCGFGAEIGTSTQKLHTRRPMGSPELTSSR